MGYKEIKEVTKLDDLELVSAIIAYLITVWLL